MVSCVELPVIQPLPTCDYLDTPQRWHDIFMRHIRYVFSTEWITDLARWLAGKTHTASKFCSTLRTKADKNFSRLNYLYQDFAASPHHIFPTGVVTLPQVEVADVTSSWRKLAKLVPPPQNISDQVIWIPVAKNVVRKALKLASDTIHSHSTRTGDHTMATLDVCATEGDSYYLNASLDDVSATPLDDIGAIPLNDVSATPLDDVGATRFITENVVTRDDVGYSRNVSGVSGNFCPVRPLSTRYEHR